MGATLPDLCVSWFFASSFFIYFLRADWEGLIGARVQHIATIRCHIALAIVTDGQ